MLPAPLPQLPDFSSLDKEDRWKGRLAQVTTLLKLGQAVLQPTDLGSLASKLQDIKTEALWVLMAQYYLPVQQLQAVGGYDAAVRALAAKLLGQVMAGGDSA
jgi:hypothetical protein